MREIGGNSLKLFFGRILKRISDRLIKKGKMTIIENPQFTFHNAFTLIISFTVDRTDKYQIVLQGMYMDKYKIFKNEENINPAITEDELYSLIVQHKSNWHLKEVVV